MGIYVEYGAGTTVGEGWLSYDSSPTLRLERLPLIGRRLGKLAGGHAPFPKEIHYGDIVRGLPLQDSSVDGIYASHVLEHLALEDMRTALSNTIKLLKPGGVFRVIVPDLTIATQHYMEEVGDPDAAFRFLSGTWLGREKRERTIIGRLREIIGSSHHLWMYDYPAMERELVEAGFTSLRIAQFGDAEDSMFNLIEHPDRFENSVAIQAFRPVN
jgi:SAM-dependent methyltransferase